ncbi:hypothetical protein [Methylobacterium haplocladii]|uniref:hypothetical protein n=1 Tax=Methylobacterium haplocladii TaxID=1176176 RepID=UPI0011BE0080|nr:hypothetical protein [Methylobacterium haplocladii]GJD82815.1 hypothetical protein HPGCJGGD_0676 [Methylobacterium haplocladii]GLS60180.1 hypothetical protein GCM10007887_28580 [Methylobacterium haplocladii]
MIQRLVVVLLCLAPVAGEAAPRSRIVKDDAAAKIVVYDSLCDEDNALECLIAEIGCAAPGDFFATVHNLDAKQAAAVFAKANGKGSVAAGGASFGLQVSKVALSDYTFNWDVTAVALEKGGEVWKAIWGASEVQLQAGPKTVRLQRSDVGEAGYREVVQTCLAGQ